MDSLKENGCQSSPETKIVVKPACNPIGQKSATESLLVLIISAGMGCQPHPIILHENIIIFQILGVYQNSVEGLASSKTTCYSFVKFNYDVKWHN